MRVEENSHRSATSHVIPMKYHVFRQPIRRAAENSPGLIRAENNCFKEEAQEFHQGSIGSGSHAHNSEMPLQTPIHVVYYAVQDSLVAEYYSCNV